MKTDHDASPPPFVRRAPVGAPAPFLFAVPHSGRFYPPDFTQRAALKHADLRLSEDAYVDALFADIPKAGASMLVATHARAYLDLNRAENELDSQMFDPPLGETGLDASYRVIAGLGVIPRLIAEGMPIYRAPLPAREAEKRISYIHRPYHAAIQAELAAIQAQHRVACLIDCHSMPSASVTGGAGKGPDIILGDSWGKACNPDLTSLVEKLLFEAGFIVRRNVPYSGGYTTCHYGQPVIGTHCLQVEINRAIYMDERTSEPLPAFVDIQKRLTDAFTKLISMSNRWANSMVKMQHTKAAE